MGDVQKKVLLLLLGGLALSLSGSPNSFFKVLRAIGEEWEEINRQALKRAIRSLYQSQLVDAKDHRDGTTTLVLSKAGRQRALTYQLDTMTVKKQKQWDGVWRVVSFDIPEYQKRARNALRTHLKQLGFRELQKSVFIFPYPCADEVDFLIEFFQLRPYVRQLTATAIDSELHLKKRFNLL